MKARASLIVLLSLLVSGACTKSALAQRGGGGRGGGGAMRGSGGGSMRSAPSVSRPEMSRPSSYSHPTSRADFDRPASAEFDRPAPPSNYSRADLPQASRDDLGAARSAYGSGANRPGYGGALSTATPQNYGSVSRPAAAAAVAAGTVGGAALAANPNLHGRGVRETSSGSLPGGADYGVRTGPGGGEGVAVSGPRGDFAAIRGPGGQTAAAARDADGDRAAVRGPRGNTVVDRIPDECEAYYWGGHSYWYHDYYWYAPYWYNNAWHYEYRYPPTGYWYPALPDDYETVVIDEATYYTADAMYFQEGEQDGQDGYVVVPPPTTNSSGKALAVLQSTCDFVGSVTSFVATVDLDMDRYLQAGDKVPVSVHCQIRVHQPDRLAVEYKGSTADRMVVYDGRNVTVHDRLAPKFTVTGAQPRLEDSIPGVKAQQQIILPLGDLLQRDAFDTLSTAIRSAEYIGVRKVGEVECHQVAFSQDNADWQLWVRTGAQPLPMKAVIQYKQDAQAPRYAWEVRQWDLNATHPAGAFTIDQSAN